MFYYKFFVLSFRAEIGNFDTQELDAFMKENDIISSNEQFFMDQNRPYWGIMLRYLPIAKKEQNNWKSHSEHRTEKEESYKKELDDKDWPLFQRLREWREITAKSRGVPLFVIMDNIRLAKVAHHLPKTVQQFLDLGIGRKTTANYNQEIIRLIQTFEESSHEDESKKSSSSDSTQSNHEQQKNSTASEEK